MSRTPFIQHERALCWWCLKPASREGLGPHEPAFACDSKLCQGLERAYRRRLIRESRDRPRVETIKSEFFN